jgi:hypothetical protein
MNEPKILRMLVALVAAAGATTAASDAGACSTKPSSSHYYAEISKYNATLADRGASVYIYTNSLTASNPSSGFVDHELWYGVNGGCNYWVEAGFTDGATYAGGSVNQHFFWADNRNGGGYHEHYPSYAWALNHAYQVEVTWAGTACAWNVTVGGNHLGTSTGNCAGTYRCLEAGLESTNASSSQRVGGFLESWSQKDGSNNWHSGWSGANAWSYCPAQIGFVSSTATEEGLHGL